MSVVLDASALLALLFDEPGGENVGQALPGALISTLNLSETLTRFVRDGNDPEPVLDDITLMGISSVDFDETQALAAATLYPMTRAFGLSFGDRACLALGLTRNLPVLTADRAWKGLALDIEIVLIR